MVESSRQRILIVTRNLPPLIGGMERLNWHIVDELSRRAEVHVVGPEGCRDELPTGIGVTEVELKPLWRFLFLAVFGARATVREFRPDVIIGGSGLMAPVVWLASCGRQCHRVAYLHGLDITVANAIYQNLWIPFMRRMDRLVVNSSPTRNLAISAGISESKLRILNPGVSFPQALPSKERCAAFRLKWKLGDGPVLLSVGRLTRRKGLLEFVRDVLPEVAKLHPAVKLLIVGDVPSDALEADAVSPEELWDQAQKAGVEACLRLVGRLDQDQLNLAYATASVHVFPVKEVANNPEGFGMVALEAAAYGIATVAYACGGVVDAVDHGGSGYLVPPDNAAAFAGRILEQLDDPLPPVTIQAGVESRSWEKFGQRLVQLVGLS